VPPRRLWLALVGGAILVLAVACGLSPSQSSGTAGTPTPTSSLEPELLALAPKGATLGGQRSAGELLVWLASEPSQPIRGTAELDAYLVGTDGKPVTDARVTFDTDMTNMSHGLNQVVAEPVGNGHYRGTVHFSMAGPWRVVTVVERPGLATVKPRFEFRVNSR